MVHHAERDVGEPTPTRQVIFYDLFCVVYYGRLIRTKVVHGQMPPPVPLVLSGSGLALGFPQVSVGSEA